MNPRTANKLISKFADQKILVLGDIMLDSAIWGKVERISPEAPVPIVHVQKETYAPGGAANVATNIQALGGRVHLVSVVGNDINRKLLLSELNKKKISTNYLVTDKKRPTIRKTRVMGIPQHQLLRIDEELAEGISPSLEKKLLSSITKALRGVSAVVISDYAKGVLSLKVARKLIMSAQSRNIPVIVDPKPVNKDLYATATVITPNCKEALEMNGNGDDPLQAAKSLAQELDANIVLTRSEEGMSIITHSSPAVHIKTKAREVFDVTGAGDTVVAGLALSLASGTDLVKAAEIANHAAGVVVGKVGTATLTCSELKDAIKTDHNEHRRNSRKK